MTRTYIYLTAAERRGLCTLARRSGISIGEIVQMVLESATEERSRPGRAPLIPYANRFTGRDGEICDARTG